MSANVRKLAFDVGLRWMVPFQILLALAVDYFFVLNGTSSGVMSGGVMLALQGTGTNNKVALWRTLPLTRKEIGRARWWQMTGLPGVGIIVVMAAAIVLHALMTALGWAQLPARLGAGSIMRALLLQFFYPVFLTVFSLAITFARGSRSLLAYTVAIAVWAPWLLLLPHIIPLPAQTRLLLLSLTGVVTAIILYVTAPGWPEPVTQPVQLDLGARGGRAVTPGRAGQGGWLALCGMALARAGLGLAAILAFYTVIALALNMRNLATIQVQQFIPFVVILLISQLNAMALRQLRALPGSALELSAYLFLLPLAVLAVASCGVSMVLLPWLTHVPSSFDLVTASVILLVSAPLLPAVLGARQVVMSLAVSLTLVLVPLLTAVWRSVPPPWGDEKLLAGLTAAAICAGFFWMHLRISHGVSVYRFQPFVAARWRGED